ncbi:hypothetical protein BC941DRAFT_61427 [Chlamydoabsidia padenii]|nr:hypothetical protein BC941DRAFT_61427 [Chlamydoabsidia padenii]
MSLISSYSIRFNTVLYVFFILTFRRSFTKRKEKQKNASAFKKKKFFDLATITRHSQKFLVSYIQIPAQGLFDPPRNSSFFFFFFFYSIPSPKITRTVSPNVTKSRSLPLVFLMLLLVAITITR